MKPAISKSDEAPHSTMQDAAQGVSSAAHQIVRAAGQTVDGVATFRNTIRSTPLVMAFLMLGLGYVIGSITTVRPNPRRDH
jgi:hypothetical protein